VLNDVEKCSNVALLIGFSMLMGVIQRYDACGVTGMYFASSYHLD